MNIAKVEAHKKANQDDGLIPLINIVFLMLIFFMVAGHIEATDLIKVQPPASTSEQAQHDEALTIIVSTDNQLSVAGELVDISVLTTVINDRYAISEAADKFALLIKADANLPVEQLQTVLLAIKQTGLKKVALVTQLQVGDA